MTVVVDAELLRRFGGHRTDRRDDGRAQEVGRLFLAEASATKFLTVDGAGERDGVDLAVEQHAVDVVVAVALGAARASCGRRRPR